MYDVDLGSSTFDPIAEALRNQEVVSEVYQRVAKSDWFKNFESRYGGVGIANAVLNKIDPDNEVRIKKLCDRIDAIAQKILDPHVGDPKLTKILQEVCALGKAQQNLVIKRAIQNTDLSSLEDSAFENAFFSVAKEQLNFERTLATLPTAIQKVLKAAFVRDDEESVLSLRKDLVEKISDLTKSHDVDYADDYAVFLRNQIEKDVIASIENASDLLEIKNNLEELSVKFYFISYLFWLILNFITDGLSDFLFELISGFVTVLDSLAESQALRVGCPFALDPSFLVKI